MLTGRGTMRKGVNSDEAIKKDCWEMSAQVDYRKSPGLYPKRMPLKYQNIREPVYMPQQVPRSIHDLATNIDYLKPKNAQRIPPNARVRDARGPGGSGGPPIDPIMSLTQTLVSQSTQTRSRPVSVSSAHAPASVDYTGATAEMDNLLEQLRQAEANLNMVEQMNIDVREGIQAGVAQMRSELEGPLRGTPPPMGTHTRFVPTGQVAEVPPYSPATVRQLFEVPRVLSRQEQAMKRTVETIEEIPLSSMAYRRAKGWSYISRATNADLYLSGEADEPTWRTPLKTQAQIASEMP